ncbi:MAG: TetR/AcrR family transcriptional regulator [Acidimicrobiia bacterium]
MSPQPQPARSASRSATEAALQRSALELLERHGVLAGLNLREVAAAAGVNRGLVYHYFGSRRDLLRAALRSDVRSRLRDFVPTLPLPTRARYTRFFRTMLGHRRAAVLAALLILDGDKHVRMIPDVAGTRARLARDAAEGAVEAEVATDAFHAALASLVYGYMILRDRLAEELGTDVERLDDEVESVVDRLLAGVEPQPGRRTDGTG